MFDVELQAVADAAVALHKTHPSAPAVDLLEVVFRGNSGMQLAMPRDLNDPAMAPRTGLGQLIAEAFDGGMLPQDGLALTGDSADPRVVEALLKVWQVCGAIWAADFLFLSLLS